MVSQYDYWKKEEKELRYAQDCLIFTDYTEKLHEIYSRHLEIIDEILVDLAPQLDDDQYEETTSWQYEGELKELREKRQILEPIVMEKIEKEKHEELLKNLGMNQEQYDAYLKTQDETAKAARLKKMKKTR
jgi:hypothetical protein